MNEVIPAKALAGQGRFCDRACYAAWKGRHPETGGHRGGSGGRRADLDGLYVRSAWEANYARYLRWLQGLGEITSWAYEPRTFEFEKIRRGSRFYTPDFRVETVAGTIEWHEVKGWMDARSATKIKRFKKYYPQEVFVLVDKPAYTAIARQVRNLVPGWETSPDHGT